METSHYVWIKNFNKLCFKVTKFEGKKYFCKYCIQHFSCKERLQKHKIDCMVLTKCQAIEMPVEGEYSKFKSFRETIKILFFIYADLEAMLEKLTVPEKLEDNTENTLLVHIDMKSFVATMRNSLNHSKCMVVWIVSANSSVIHLKKNKKSYKNLENSKKNNKYFIW